MNKDEKYKLYQELLDEFSGSDDLRPVLMKPFSDGVDVCASDCHWMLRIKPEATGLKDVPNGLKRINVKYLPKPLILHLDDVVKALLACKMVDETEEIKPAVECKECEGDGTVEWEFHDSHYNCYNKYDDCPICRGTGYLKEAVVRKTGRKVPRYASEAIRINNVNFDSWRLFYLVEYCTKLGVDDVVVTALSKDNAMAIQLNDDIEFILMPFNALDSVANITLTEKK